MATMYERIDSLCKEKGTNVTAMCKELVIARSSLSELNKGRTKTLSYEALSKIANYLEVTTDYLVTGQETAKDLDVIKKEPVPELTSKDERDIARMLENALAQLQNEQTAVMFDGEPIDEKTKEALRISLENQYKMAKILAKEKFTPKKYRKKEE